MTAPVGSTETKSKSRRALLAGALGGLGAWAASAVGRASPVQAADGDVIHVGDELTAGSVTKLSNAANGDIVLWGNSTLGIGVEGSSSSSIGVYGSSASSAGVYGASGSSHGVHGQSESSYGVHGQSESSVGVHGASPVIAVFGEGQASGTGVRGQTTSGIGLYGTATSGFALLTAGRAKFSTSGVATITAGNTSVTVTPNVNITSGSFVLLTPKANLGSRALWFTTNATADTFTIRMSSARSSGTKVAWLLLG